MKLPAELFVNPVQGDDDIIAFNFPFELQTKALEDGTPANLVEVMEDGDLIIEGFASEFQGQDREGENFTDGAFQRGIKSFLEGPAALVFHHKTEKVLGKVLDLEEVAGRGLRMRARVDGAIKDHPELGVIYHQIKKGTLTGLSVGGFFKRKLTQAGRKIIDTDMTEISVTGVPCHSKPAFSVVAGKALEVGEPNATRDAHAGNDGTTEIDGQLGELSEALENLSDTFDKIEGKSVKGDPQDLHMLSHVIALGHAVHGYEESETSHPKVSELTKNVKDNIDEHARTAHKLAAKLGPLPDHYGN